MNRKRGQQGGIPEEMVGLALLLSLVIVIGGISAVAAHGYDAGRIRNEKVAAINGIATRALRDIRTARAHRVPPSDVLGNDNSDAHEWDALYEDGVGNYSCRAQVWEAATRTVQNYAFPCTGGAPAPDGQPIGPVTSFVAQRITADSFGDPSSPYYVPLLSGDPTHRPLDVELPTGVAGFNAGNAVLAVTLANDAQSVSVHLLPGSFETQNLTSITGTYTPPPPGTCAYVSAYTGSSSTGWTPTSSTSTWQWFQPPAPCVSATTPPPASYVTAYVNNCDATFYAAQTGTVTWQQQPMPDATTPPPTTAIIAYDPTTGAPIYQSFAWNQGPCPHPTPPLDPQTPTPGPTSTPVPPGPTPTPDPVVTPLAACPDTVFFYLGAGSTSPAPGENISARSQDFGPYPISGEYGTWYIVTDSLYPGHAFDALHDVVPVQGKDNVVCFDNGNAPQPYPYNF